MIKVKSILRTIFAITFTFLSFFLLVGVASVFTGGSFILSMQFWTFSACFISIMSVLSEKQSLWLFEMCENFWKTKIGTFCEKACRVIYGDVFFESLSMVILLLWGAPIIVFCFFFFKYGHYATDRLFYVSFNTSKFSKPYRIRCKRLKKLCKRELVINSKIMKKLSLLEKDDLQNDKDFI